MQFVIVVFPDHTHLLFVLNDRQIKVAELASECGFSNGSVHIIIHEHLGLLQKTIKNIMHGRVKMYVIR